MSLDELRNKIDELDAQIVALLSKRASVAATIGEQKRAEGQLTFVPEREQEVLARAQAQSSGPLTRQALRTIYREVVSACRALEGEIRVAYLGPPGTFSHMAAQHAFGSSAVLCPSTDIADVFHDALQGRTDYGLVPVENSTEGVVSDTLDRLVKSDLSVCAEVLLDVHHCLLGRSELSEVRRVYSQFQALRQCENWLRRNLPTAELVEETSTVRGAERAAQEAGAAAVAPETAAPVYDLKVLVRNIEDYEPNRTRFLVLGRRTPRPTGQDKTSIVVSTKHQPGALVQALVPFRKHGLNMTMIQSRPVKDRPWEYLFFIDFQGHQEDAIVKRALKDVGRACVFLRVLGSYPEGG